MTRSWRPATSRTGRNTARIPRATRVGRPEPCHWIGATHPAEVGGGGGAESGLLRHQINRARIFCHAVAGSVDEKNSTDCGKNSRLQYPPDMNGDKKELISGICWLLVLLGIFLAVGAAFCMFAPPGFRTKTHISGAIAVLVVSGLASVGLSVEMMLGIGIALGTAGTIGLCLLGGKKSAEAAKWCREAEQGNAGDQCHLGVMYAIGDGVRKDSTEAAKWFRKSAEQGNATAQSSLGSAYYVGNGVIKDIVQAHAWLNNASANGDERIRELMGFIEKQMTPEQIAEATKLAREIFERIQARKK
jgi:TPR repeat protein